MKKILIILSVLVLMPVGCSQPTKKQAETGSHTKNIKDTLIVKHKENGADFYSQSYSYHWLVAKDTLDFIVYADEWKDNGELSLKIAHRKPILFAEALKRIDACLPLLREDFDISKLTSVNFEQPIYYLDLAKKLSDEYEQKFGRKTVRYNMFNQFLLQSSLNAQLNNVLQSLNKEVKHYGFEKFFLIDKKDYKSYLPDVDFMEYPEFTFNAHSGVSVVLEDK